MNNSLKRQKSSDSGDNNALRKRSSTSTLNTSKKETKIGEKLIDAEKTETGSVSLSVYKHYLKSIGIFLTLATIVLNIIFQAFSVGSNFWLVKWSGDKSLIRDDNSTDIDRRNMYLGVYGAMGLGQGEFFLLAVSLPTLLLFPFFH